MERVPPTLYFSQSSFETTATADVQRIWNARHFSQRTPEWYASRKNCITASAAAAALFKTEDVCRHYIDTFHLDDFKIDPKKNCSYKDSPLTIILDKCGFQSDFKGNSYTDWGQKYEPVATLIYSQMKKIDVLEFGLVVHPEIEYLAASPDGICTDGTMLEIKCPSARSASPVPPLYYYIQMMLQLHCTGLKKCDYFDANFVEYVSEEDWRNDAMQWERLNHDATHHVFGIFLTDPESGCHSYANVKTHTVDEFLRWSNEHDRLIPTHYKLDKHFVSSVTACDRWFESVLPEFDKLWKKIEFYRTESGEKMLTQKLKNGQKYHIF
jgi:putative phage-type endonuclease